MMITRLINNSQKNKSDFKVRATLDLMSIEKFVVLTEKARSGLPGFRIKHDLSHLFIAILFFLIAGTATAGHPLEPVDTSSPRATIESFYALTKETSELYFKFRDSPSPDTQSALWKVTDKSRRLFDLSKTPPAVQRKVADETFYLLWEVIARLDMPDLESIPGASAYAAQSEKTEEVIRWFIPGTEISIVRVEDGLNAGQFLFSADTVKRISDFYERSKGLPYLQPMSINNVYQINQLVTGWMIPLIWTESLPEWANTSLAGQLLWKWLILLLLYVLAVALLIAVFLKSRRYPDNNSVCSYLRKLVTPVSLLVLVNSLWFFAIQQINVTGAAAELPDYIQKLAHGVVAIWVTLLSLHWLAESIIAPRVNTVSLNASLIRFSMRFIAIALVIVIIFNLLHDLGIPVYGLIAGAGVGGLAVALAARSTLENFMGTLNLFADRPIRVGELCYYGEGNSPGQQRIGTVEEIGLRSTSIRGLDRSITTIPNASFSNLHITNLTKRDRILFRKTIHLRYETTSEQMRLLLTQLREMLSVHPQTNNENARVRALGFGEYSLDVEIYVYVMATEWADFLVVQEDLVLRIMDIIDKAGMVIAIPSRTVYQRQDVEPGIETGSVSQDDVELLAPSI